jgi:hypothetical protein
LARCILGVIAAPAAQRRAWGENLRQTVEARFDIERVWGMYLSLYASI